MSTSSFDWRSISQLTGDPLKNQVFSILYETSCSIQEETLGEPQMLEVVPRLAQLIDAREELTSFREVFSALARSLGLWNYIDREFADLRDGFVADTAEIPDLNIVLHREQQSALNSLLAGNNLVLSAPTSFGKSILIDALLLEDRFRRVAIVLPTIALLDEFRRRLIRQFGGAFDILMHHSETSESEKVIFLGTQERLINRTDLGKLDLVVVDEFYKLDPDRKDTRSMTLNAAVYRLLSKSKQFFFLGPNIDIVNVSAGSRWQFSFLKTRFSTVAVDTADLSGIEDKEDRLLEESKKPENWPALVFVSSPDKANNLAALMVERGLRMGAGPELSGWMNENYGAGWGLSAAVAAGIGVHHARIPRALASRFVSLFNQNVLPVLICTSTLIEGVNTAAKSVLIYDKTINRSNYDFFTFSNIKGRAGRLGKHHVGQVFLFNAPPEKQDYGITAPLFGDVDDAPDEYIVHVEGDDATKATATRILELAERLNLRPEDLRRFSTIGIGVIEMFRDAVAVALAEGKGLVWTGYPSWENILTLAKILCSVRRADEFGCRTPLQLTMYIQQLRNARQVKRFFLWHSESYRGKAEQRDNIFKFLRACEFNLPEFIALIELLVKNAGNEADYTFLTGGLPRWFRAEELKILEEQGVPIQISERFHRDGDSVRSLAARLRDLAHSRDARISIFERNWILEALPS
jgi:hypothetical protein